MGKHQVGKDVKFHKKQKSHNEKAVKATLTPEVAVSMVKQIFSACKEGQSALLVLDDQSCEIPLEAFKTGKMQVSFEATEEKGKVEFKLKWHNETPQHEKRNKKEASEPSTID